MKRRSNRGLVLLLALCMAATPAAFAQDEAAAEAASPDLETIIVENGPVDEAPAEDMPKKRDPIRGNLNLWVSYFIPGANTYDDARYVDAEILTSEAKDELAKSGHRLAYTYDKKGMALFALGEYEDAEWCLKEALCLKEKSLGKNARPVPETLNNLADLYYVAGDMDKVEPLYRRSLEILEDDQYSVEVCRALNGMALIHYQRGEYEQVEGLLKQAAYLHEKANRRVSPYMGTVLTNLATLYTHLNRLDEAEKAFEEAERVQKTVLGEDHPDVAIRLSSYAVYLMKLGQVNDAHEAESKAEAIKAKSKMVNDVALLQ